MKKLKQKRKESDKSENLKVLYILKQVKGETSKQLLPKKYNTHKKSSYTIVGSNENNWKKIEELQQLGQEKKKEDLWLSE